VSDERDSRGKLRSVGSFLIGGVVGAGAALVTHRRRRPLAKPPGGLAAFEDAPCYREASERKR